MAEQLSTNQFKNGMHIELDGDVWRIVEFQHVKPGKGGAFVRTKLKALGSGAVVDRTFRAGEKFPRTDTEPGVKGDTVSNVTKPATLETGAVVQVPLFVNVGDRIKIDPRERRYISRA